MRERERERERDAISHTGLEKRHIIDLIINIVSKKGPCCTLLFIREFDPKA
jgi:hypothetical protein